MKIGVYLCACGSNISDKINFQEIKVVVEKIENVAYVTNLDMMCSYEGLKDFEGHLRVHQPDRVIVAACSPRDHENTFMLAMGNAGINPYLMQMVNFREQLAWVTSDSDRATQKAIQLLKGACSRVVLHESLGKESIDLNSDVLIIGAGPAGLKAALTLAQADRRVTVVEKSPMMGGKAVRYEELFPKMECGPCMLEPLEAQIVHGPYAGNINLITLAEIIEVKGFFGNYIVKIKKNPRYVDIHNCIGCAECVNACPVSIDNEINFGMNKKKAMDFTFFGALPNATYIDMKSCLRSKGEDCQACQAACPIQGVVNLEDKEETIEKNVGAIILATGHSLYDVSKFPKLGYGHIEDVYTSMQFERMLSASGPTGKQIILKNGLEPKTVAIIHCVGSMDSHHAPYCSGVCCQSGFKYNYEFHHKLPGTKVYHLYKELVSPGKDSYGLYNSAVHNQDASFIRYNNIDDLEIDAHHGQKSLFYRDATGHKHRINLDMVVLLPAVVPNADSALLAQILDVGTDKMGFFEELHGIVDSTKSKVKGVYLAGSCQSPKDIKDSMTQGSAAAGNILSVLVPGRQLDIESITAWVIEEKCAGCKVCSSVCPYKAISFQEETKKSIINAVLCQGCGTCVAACPAEAIVGNFFTTEEIFAEIKGVLA